MAAHTETSAPSQKDRLQIKWIRNFLPVGFKQEFKELFTLAAPAIVARFLNMALGLVSIIFCGHLGRVELASVSLAIMVINITGISVGFGLSSACDTLIPQTFGSHNVQRVGVILQRAVLILMLACFPCWAILINTEVILLAIRQEAEVARLALVYVKIYMPALPATFMYSLQTKYLQHQGIIWPEVITGFLVNLLNALLNYIFLYPLNMGVVGSAVANTLSRFSLFGVLYCYIVGTGLYKATWTGWSKACLQDWGSYLSLAIPSIAMICIKWWTYEIAGFLAGLIDEVELGAQTIIYQLANIALTFPLGFNIAGNIRVGNSLGANNTEQAKLSAKSAMLCAVSVSICLATVIGALRDYIPYVFTNDEKIRKRVADVTRLYPPFIICDAISVVTGGIIRGVGKQKVGAICNILGFYGVGIPIGASLMFAAKLGITGLWIGLLTCMFPQVSFMIFYLLKLNWKKVTEEAQIRVGNASDTESQAQLDRSETEETSAMPSQEQTSHRFLVLRRGLALAFMLFILAFGIVFNLLIERAAPYLNHSNNSVYAVLQFSL